VSSALLWLFIYVSLKKIQWYYAALLIWGLYLTRIPAGIGASVWILSLLIWSKLSASRRTQYILLLLLPIVISVISTGLYNYLRFGDVLEMGYGKQLTYEEPLKQAKSYGLFNIIHVPGNVYYSLLATPLPVLRDGVSRVLAFPYIKENPWGMSILITSLYLFYLFRVFKYTDNNRGYMLAFIGGLIPIYTYYGIGYLQYGYRYMLDVFPWLFLVLMFSVWEKFKVVPTTLKALIILSAAVNMYLLLTGHFRDVIYHIFFPDMFK
jgi:hypothetical protein